MLLNQNSLEKNSERIVNLDFLRGFFIILALNQHFTYYINMWYVDYFRDAIALRTTYKIHFPLIGEQIPTDVFNQFLAIIFTPWVSQIYLTMAAFNLAKRTPVEFASTLLPKFRVFGLILFFFIIENMIVAPNFGQAISIYPIMLWMVILTILSLTYRYIGIAGILGVSLLACMRFVVPMELISDFLQSLIADNLHPGFEYDARLEYFILSGCMGFIMGYIHYHRKVIAYKKDMIFVILGAFMASFYVFWGDTFTADVYDILRTEHDLARTFTGTSYILGIQAIVISAFLWLERKNIKLNVPIVNWVGKNSLMIFGFHRILFVRVIAPFSVFLGSVFGYTLGASILEVFTYISITVAICYFVKLTNLAGLILQQKD